MLMLQVPNTFHWCWCKAQWDRCFLTLHLCFSVCYSSFFLIVSLIVNIWIEAQGDYDQAHLWRSWRARLLVSSRTLKMHWRRCLWWPLRNMENVLSACLLSDKLLSTLPIPSLPSSDWLVGNLMIKRFRRIRNTGQLFPRLEGLRAKLNSQSL